MTVGKVFRAIITKIIINKIAVFIVISKLAGKPHVTSSNRVFNVFSQVLRCDVGILCKLNVGTKRMCFEESTVPMQQQIKKFTTRSITSRRLIHIDSIKRFLKFELSGYCVSFGSRIQCRVFDMRDGVRIVGIIPETGCKMEALGNKIQLLF